MNSEVSVAHVSLLLETIRQRVVGGELDAEVITAQLQYILRSNQNYSVDHEGNIHLTLTAKGWTPAEWGHYFQRKGQKFSESAIHTLYCANGVSAKNSVYKLVIRPGYLIADSDRVTRRLRAYATEKGWESPHWEAICLFRDEVTDEQLGQMGLKNIVVMHDPIVDLDGHTCLLGANVHGDGLDVYLDDPNNEWSRSSSFMHIEK